MIPLIPVIGALIVGYRAGTGKGILPGLIKVKEKERPKPPQFTAAQLAMLVEPSPAGRRFRPKIAAGLNKRLDLCSLENIDDRDGVLLYKVVPLGAESAGDVVRRAREVGALVFASLSIILTDSEKLIGICDPSLSVKLTRSPHFAILPGSTTAPAPSKSMNGVHKPASPPGPPPDPITDGPVTEKKEG